MSSTSGTSTAATTSSTLDAVDQLKAILARNNASLQQPLLQQRLPIELTTIEFDLLFDSFQFEFEFDDQATSPSRPLLRRSLALAVLSQIFSSTKTTTTTTMTATQSQFLQRLVNQLDPTNVKGLPIAFNVLSALLSIDPMFVVGKVLSTDSKESILDRLQLAIQHVMRTNSSTKSNDPTVVVALLDFLSIAAGQTKLNKFMTRPLGLGQTSIRDWIQETVLGGKESLERIGIDPRQQNDIESWTIKALAGLILIKLTLGANSSSDDPLLETTGSSKDGPSPHPKIKEEKYDWNLSEFSTLFQNVFVKLAGNTRRKLLLPLRQNEESGLLTCLEGLAYLTLPSLPTSQGATSATIKNRLVQEGDFFVTFLRLLPELYSPSKANPTSIKFTTPALDYAIATLLCHLVQYPESEDQTGSATSDQAQIARLKRLAQAKVNQAKGIKEDQTEASKETKEQVNSRIEKIVETSSTPPSGLFPTIRQLCLGSSPSTRKVTGKLLHCLVTPQSTRGVCLQAGVAKMLLVLIRQSSASNANDSTTTELDLESIQALSKLMITTNPQLIFPEPSLLLESMSWIARIVLLASSSASSENTPSSLDRKESISLSLLTLFEALMALTNLTSLSSSFCDHLNQDSKIKLLQIVADDLILFSSSASTNAGQNYQMIQRASIELVCNLVNSQSGVDFYSPPPTTPLPSDRESNRSSSATLKNRFNILLALLGSEDVATRLAAGGTLSTLCASSNPICWGIAQDAKALQQVLNTMQEEEGGDRSGKEGAEGMRHRGFDCMASISQALAQLDDSNQKQSIRRLWKDLEVLEVIKKREEGEKDQLKALAKQVRQNLELCF